MELQKFGIKLFAAEPANTTLAEFIPLFHRWIQNRLVDGLLIDVADYSHVVDGPGILLIGHEGNYAIDDAGGRRGLLYVRKQPLPNGLSERLARGMEIALTACRELERTPDLAGRLKFRTDEILIFANDRSIAPNTDETWRACEPALSELFSRLLPQARIALEREPDPKERFAVTMRARSEVDVATLLGRLGA